VEKSFTLSIAHNLQCFVLAFFIREMVGALHIMLTSIFSRHHAATDFLFPKRRCLMCASICLAREDEESLLVSFALLGGFSIVLLLGWWRDRVLSKWLGGVEDGLEAVVAR